MPMPFWHLRLISLFSAAFKLAYLEPLLAFVKPRSGVRVPPPAPVNIQKINDFLCRGARESAVVRTFGNAKRALSPYGKAAKLKSNFDGRRNGDGFIAVAQFRPDIQSKAVAVFVGAGQA